MKLRVLHALRRIRYGSLPALYWARSEIRNWGDDLNPWLFEKLTGRTPIYCPHNDIPRLFMAGSILDQAGGMDTCWGTGFIRPDTEKRILLAKVYALRGPLTAEILEAHGNNCPRIFGDPGLFAPDFVEVDHTKRYACVVVPHYTDLVDGERFARESSAELVPVSLPIPEFVQKIASAERVYSSSLHGLICAEALGVPAYWIRFSDNLIGGNFKFRDYLAGTGRPWRNALPIDLRKESEIRASHHRPWEPFPLDEVKQKLLIGFPHELFANTPNKRTIPSDPSAGDYFRSQEATGGHTEICTDQKFSTIRVIIISSVRPEPSSAGQIILHRHLVHNPQFSLEVYGYEPSKWQLKTLFRRVVGILPRMFRTSIAEDMWTLWGGRWLDSSLPFFHKIAAPSIVLTVAHGDAWMAAQRYAKRNGLPLVSIFHDWWPDAAGVQSFLRPRLERAFRTLYLDSDLAFCVSPGMKQELGPHPNSYVLYPIPFRSISSKSQSSTPTGTIPRSSFRVLYFGNLKDYGKMLGELWLALRAHPEIRLEIRGSNPPWPSTLRESMIAAGDWLDYAPRTELNKWLARADAFIVPQCFEPAYKRRMQTNFPSKLTEYLAFGKPCIVWGPDYASAALWANDSGDAVLVTNCNPDTACQAISDLATSPDRQSEFSRRAIHAASRDFSYDKIQRVFYSNLRKTVDAFERSANY